MFQWWLISLVVEHRENEKGVIFWFAVLAPTLSAQKVSDPSVGLALDVFRPVRCTCGLWVVRPIMRWLREWFWLVLFEILIFVDFEHFEREMRLVKVMFICWCVRGQIKLIENGIFRHILIQLKQNLSYLFCCEYTICGRRFYIRAKINNCFKIHVFEHSHSQSRRFEKEKKITRPSQHSGDYVVIECGLHKHGLLVAS